VVTAREAYSEASRLSPSNPEIVAALRRLDDNRREATLPHVFDLEGSPR
jgi:hypothetical protein